MTPEQLAYWLQGFFEITGDVPLTKREQIIKDHVKEVFTKKTPAYQQSNPFGAAPVQLPTFPQNPPNYPGQPPFIC